MILDSRPVHSAAATSPAMIDAQQKKPKVPVHAVMTARQPMVRFIGGDDMALGTVSRLASDPGEWHQSGTPWLFLHTPDIAFAPALVDTLWGDLRAALPAAGSGAVYSAAIFSFLISCYHIQGHLPELKGVFVWSARCMPFLGALLLVKFSFDVVRLRTQYHVGYGDGGFSGLHVCRRYGNAVEYVPIGLILLLFMEMNGAQTWMVHVCGILLIVGRLMHSWGFSSPRLLLAPAPA